MEFQLKTNAKPIIIHFERDTEASVSWETANAHVTITGASSIEALILNALANLKHSLKIAYPLYDGLQTPEEFPAIERLASQKMPLTLASCLFNESSEKTPTQTTLTELEKLITGVSEENKHSIIDFGKRVGREYL